LKVLGIADQSAGSSQLKRRKRESAPSSGAADQCRFEIDQSESHVTREEIRKGNLAATQEIVHQDMRVDKGHSSYWLRPLAHWPIVERAKSRISQLRRVKYIAINVFLAFHILAIACWCMPLDTPLVPLCRNLIRPYFLWSGLFQSWDMFAPIPKAANTYVEAVVIYTDGSRKIWTLPRPQQLGLTERYFRERYRKFADNLPLEENEALLPDAARYIARLNSTSAKPVKTVILIQRFSFIVPRLDGSYVAEPWEQHILLGYGVRPEDLK